METALVNLELDDVGDRVREHSPSVVNRRIDTMTRASVEACVRERRDAIVRRLGELDREWDIDRAMFVNFAVIGGAVLAGGVTNLPFRKGKGLLGLFGVQMAFLFVHGVLGWCPPVSLFRRLGFRTAREIESERCALRGALG